MRPPAAEEDGRYGNQATRCNDQKHCAGMPALVLIPFFADAIFHRGSRGLGFLMGGMGIGAVIVTLGGPVSMTQL